MAGESCSYCERDIGLDNISAYLPGSFHPCQVNARSYLPLMILHAKTIQSQSEWRTESRRENDTRHLIYFSFRDRKSSTDRPINADHARSPDRLARA